MTATTRLPSSFRHDDHVTVYILGMLYFEGEHKSIDPLDGPSHHAILRFLQEQLLLTGEFEQDLDRGFYLGSLDPKRIRGSRRTALRSRPETSEKEIDAFIDSITEIFVGLWGHRVIFCFHSDWARARWLEVHDAVIELHERVRDLFASLPAQIGDRSLMHVYTYPLVVLPGDKLSHYHGPDRIYNERNASFGITFFDSEASGGIGHLIRRGGEQYISLSTTATVIHLRGDRLGCSLLDDIVDSIYLGGLCRNAFLDWERRPSRRRDSFEPSNGWTHELLTSVFEILERFAVNNSLSRRTTLLSQMMVLVGGAAILVALLPLTCGHLGGASQHDGGKGGPGVEEQAPPSGPGTPQHPQEHPGRWLPPDDDIFGELEPDTLVRGESLLVAGGGPPCMFPCSVELAGIRREIDKIAARVGEQSCSLSEIERAAARIKRVCKEGAGRATEGIPEAP